jgi:hypothetical protein
MPFEINIKEQEVYVNDKLIYSLPYTIKDYVTEGSLLILLLEIPFDIVFNENIFSSPQCLPPANL